MPPTQTEASSSSSSNSFDESLPLSPSFDAPSTPASSEECNTSADAPQLEQEEDDQEKETVIVFDWDDTLLSSTFLASKGYRLDSNMTNCSPELLSALASLSASVCAVLKLASTFGRVHILTNAETGWVELSAQKFLPAVVPLLSSLNITVLSARSTFECQFPDMPLKWKCCGFSHLLDPLLSQKHIFKNVLSFGDSHVEREAVRAVTCNVDNTLCKSVKFAERPTCEQLRRQIDLVTNCMNYIHNHNNHLDLQLTVTVNDTQTPQEEAEQDKMKCPEPSSMPEHDDGCGGHRPSSTSSSYMKMDEEEESQLQQDQAAQHSTLNEEDEEKVVEAY